MKTIQQILTIVFGLALAVLVVYTMVYPFYHCGFWEVVFYGKSSFWAALFGVCHG